MEQDNEQWKSIDGYVGIYEVSNLGRVRGVDRVYMRKNGSPYRKKGVVIKPSVSNSGYLFVALRNNNTRRNFYVHRLVASAFISNPNNEKEIDHINGVKTDNRAENLRWCSRSGNLTNPLCVARRSGENSFLFGKTGATSFRSRAIDQYSIDGNFIRRWDSLAQAYEECKYDRGLLINTCKGRRKEAYGYIWKYAEPNGNQSPKIPRK